MVEGDEDGGDHVVGECCAEVGAEVGDGEVGVGDGVGDESAVSVGALVGDDDAFADVGVGEEGGFDFAEFDAEAADLDLVVGAAEVFEGAVGAPAGDVAGAVHAFAGLAVGVEGEAFGGEGGAVEVAAGESAAGDVDFAGDAGGYVPAVFVEEVDVVSGQGAACGEAAAGGEVVGGDVLVGDVDGGFGDAVHVDQAGAGGFVALEPGRHVLGFQRLPTEDHPAQRGKPLLARARRVLHQLPEHRGGLVEHRDPLLPQEPPHGVGVACGVVGDDHGVAAGHQGAPQFPDGEVEGVGVEDRPHVVRAEPVQGLGVGHEVQDVVVFDRHALGAAGGAGGVDDVGQVGGGHTCPRGCHRQAGDRLVLGVQVDDPYVSERQSAAQVAVGDEDFGAGVVEHVGEPVGGVGGVQGHVGGAGLEDAEQADGHLCAAFDGQGDQASGSGAE